MVGLACEQRRRSLRQLMEVAKLRGTQLRLTLAVRWKQLATAGQNISLAVLLLDWGAMGCRCEGL